MLTFSEVIAIVAIIVALYGWTTLLYNWITSKPKIKGKIFNVITGDLKNPNRPSQTLTAFNVYLYLTNTRKNTVHILDYELEVDIGNGYKKMGRFYGAHRIPRWSFISASLKIDIPDFPQKLITAQAEPVKYGIPLHGFVLFVSGEPKNQFLENVKKFRVTCVDAFGNRHKIVSCPKQFPNIYLLQDLAGITLTVIKT